MSNIHPHDNIKSLTIFIEKFYYFPRIEKGTVIEKNILFIYESNMEIFNIVK